MGRRCLSASPRSTITCPRAGSSAAPCTSSPRLSSATCRPRSASSRRCSAARSAKPMGQASSCCPAAALPISAGPTRKACASFASIRDGSSSPRPSPIGRPSGRWRRRCGCGPSRPSQAGSTPRSISRRAAGCISRRKARAPCFSSCAPPMRTRQTPRSRAGASPRRLPPATASAALRDGAGASGSNAAATGARANG